MSEREKTTAQRLADMLSRMTDYQREIILARGEGLVEGYKMAQAESALIQQSIIRTAP